MFLARALLLLGSVRAAVVASAVAGSLFSSNSLAAEADAVKSGKMPDAITIGFIPGENPALLKESAGEFAKLLQARIGHPVKVHIGRDYSGLIDDMKSKKVDFAFFTAMTYVFAEKMAGAKVLLKKVWHSPYYHAVILAKKAGGNVKTLKGGRFAFVDEKSASGYLYPMVYFKKNGIDPKTYFKEIRFSGHHDASVRLLEEGKVDAIAVFSNNREGSDSAWRLYGGKGGVKQIWISAPIPNDPFCVRQDFYDQQPRLTHDLMFAMIELLDDPKDGARFKQALGASSLMLATSQQYEPVREMVRELDLKLD